MLVLGKVVAACSSPYLRPASYCMHRSLEQFVVGFRLFILDSFHVTLLCRMTMERVAASSSPSVVWSVCWAVHPFFLNWYVQC